MIYCVGWKASYDEGIAAHGRDFRKSGRGPDYPGGSVWATRAEAEQYAATVPGYAAYGVEADWDADTVPSEEGHWHDLLADAVIVPLT